MFLKGRRRRKLRAAPFPLAWEAVLDQNVPLWKRLPADDRAELRGHIQVLLAEKLFEGVRSLTVTEEMKVTVAAWGGLLLLHRETKYYPRLVSIVLYPGAFLVHRKTRGDDGIVTEGPEARIGESWKQGTLILAWDEVRADAEDADDGYNVAIHEFAHQLDGEDGHLDGTPPLEFDLAREWKWVMEEGYRKLQRASERRQDTFLDHYAAESPAEFFAVITESFFEMPRELRHHHPDVYRLLAAYFRQDPAGWSI